MQKKTKDIFIIGFAMFAMFFGAGNLIFPPALGQQAGTNLIGAIFGFLLTGVGLPLMGIMAVLKFGGTLESLAAQANKKFATVLNIVVILSLGPLLAIPRTSATTYEMAIVPFFPDMNSLVFSAIYFSILLFFVLKSSSIIDNIAKILTPVLLITLLSIIIKGILSPQGAIVDTGLGVSFANGFSEGYQTMDALGATVIGAIIVVAIKAKGYTETKEISRITVQASIVAAVGLSIFYGGLAYLGATAGNSTMDLSRPELIISITEGLLGKFGKVLLAISAGMACLTTSIGLTATAGEYFSTLSKGRVSFKTVSIITALISLVISNAGVDKITSFAIPLLVVVYPIIIVLVVLALLDRFIINNIIYTGTVLITLVISLFDTLVNYNVSVPMINTAVKSLPFASQGLGWIVPALAVGLSLHLFATVKQQKHQKISLKTNYSQKH